MTAHTPRIDRRALFASGSAAALLAAAGVSAAPAPRRGRHVRAALSGGERGKGWDHVPGGNFLQAARNAVFETLTEIAPDGTLQPGLASGWQSAEQGRVWRFDILDDVAFHDGADMTPSDVAASLIHHGFDARVQDRGVTVSLDKADAAFPFAAAEQGLAIFKAEELAQGAVTQGTGLYRLVRFDPGRSFLGERVETHRKDGSAGWFDRVELVAVSDPRARVDAVKTGVVDVADIEPDAELTAQDLRAEGDRPVILRAGDLPRAALSPKVMTGPRTGAMPLDDMRFATRWWMAG